MVSTVWQGFLFMRSPGLACYGVGPAVRGFVEPDARQTQTVAEAGAVNRFEHAKSLLGHIFSGRHPVENDRFVLWQALQKFDDDAILFSDDKSVIPQIDQMPFGQRFDFRKIHHHAVVGIAGIVVNGSGQGDLHGVAMAMQIAALTLMVGDTVSGVEFQTAGNVHRI